MVFKKITLIWIFDPKQFLRIITFFKIYYILIFELFENHSTIGFFLSMPVEFFSLFQYHEFSPWYPFNGLFQCICAGCIKASCWEYCSWLLEFIANLILELL